MDMNTIMKLGPLLEKNRRANELHEIDKLNKLTKLSETRAKAAQTVPNLEVPPPPASVPSTVVPELPQLNTKAVPTVQGVTDPFQQWKNATMGVESSYGNDPDTWKTNSSGARGLYQLTEATFNGLKKNGKIPKDYDFTNPVHNTEASEKLAEEVWERAGQDPRKASAIWYSGPKAIDKNTGEIKSFTDPKNPDYPNTIQHVDKVSKVMGIPEVPAPATGEWQVGEPTLRPGFATIEGQTQGKYNQQPTIQNDNVAANQKVVLGGVPASTKMVKGEVPVPPPGAKTPEEMGINVPSLEAPPAISEDKGGDIVPSYNEEDLNAAVESLNSEEKAKHNAVGVAGSKADANGIAAEVANYARERDLKGKSGVAPERKEDLSPTFWEKLSESFGELFTDKEFIKFGILLAGGMLTGGSFGGSLKYAGLYALKSADARQAAKAASAAELAKEERAAKRESDKDLRERGQSLQTSISSALSNTKISPAIRNEGYKQLNEIMGLPESERVPALNDLLNRVNKNASDAKPLQSSQIVVDGTPTDTWVNPDTKQHYIKVPNDNGGFELRPVQGMDVKEYSSLVKGVEDSVSKMVAAKISPELKNRSEIANSVAAMTTAVIQDMTTFGSKILPKDVAVMADNAMREVGGYQAGTDYDQWSDKFKAALYTTAATQIYPSRKELFITQQGEPLRGEAYSRIRTELSGEKLEPALNKLIDQFDLAMKDKAIAEKVDATLKSDAGVGHSRMSMYLELKALQKL